MRRILFVSLPCLLDDSVGAAISSREMLSALQSRGFSVEALCGSRLGLGREIDLVSWLSERGHHPMPMREPRDETSPCIRLNWDGVEVTLHVGPTWNPLEPDASESEAYLRLYRAAVARFCPDIVVGYGGNRPITEAFALARREGRATAFLAHSLGYRDPSTFSNIAAIATPTAFAADYYRDALGLNCVVLPNIVEPERVRVEADPVGYVTFVNPSVAKGVGIFAKIADELGRRRPDIRFLVVESRANQNSLAACDVDLQAHGNVLVMEHTPDPRCFWGSTRILLLPSLGLENQPRVAIEAMINGIPVIGSDRGGIPETLGDSGFVMPLTDRLTPATPESPTADEIAPWVSIIIRLWDDPAFVDEHRRRSLEVSRRWQVDGVADRYVDFFRSIRPETTPVVAAPPNRSRSVVLVPHLNGIEPECEEGLARLEKAGIRVQRRVGSSAIDAARNEMASDALHDGCESILFIDSDIGFDPLDALRLLARPEAVVCGIYVKKGERGLTSQFVDGTSVVRFGMGAPGFYPLRYAATGFLRIKATVLHAMIDALGLPLCNSKWGRGVWPFFQPMIAPMDDRGSHYLGEDWAFSHRLRQIGVTPLADTSFRLWHWGRYGYSWEDVGMTFKRYRTFDYHFTPSPDRKVD